MKKFAFASSLLALPALACAQSLVLEYSVEDIGGLYEYEFFLSTDDGWQQGMGWRWFIWGDQAPPPAR